jgi:hypothetical protein
MLFVKQYYTRASQVGKYGGSHHLHQYQNGAGRLYFHLTVVTFYEDYTITGGRAIYLTSTPSIDRRHGGWVFRN